MNVINKQTTWDDFKTTRVTSLFTEVPALERGHSRCPQGADMQRAELSLTLQPRRPWAPGGLASPSRELPSEKGKGAPTVSPSVQLPGLIEPSSCGRTGPEAGCAVASPAGTAPPGRTAGRGLPGSRKVNTAKFTRASPLPGPGLVS